VEGFSHRLPLLAHRLLSSLAQGGPSRANWDTVHEALVRKYRNMAMEVRVPWSWHAHTHALARTDASTDRFTHVRVRGTKKQQWKHAHPAFPPGRGCSHTQGHMHMRQAMEHLVGLSASSPHASSAVTHGGDHRPQSHAVGQGRTSWPSWQWLWQQLSALRWARLPG